MSIFAVTGLLLAIPAGFIFQRLGYRMTGLIAIFSLLLGAGIGTFSGTMEIMLASRFIEGAGLSLMSVVAPAVLALWFTAENRGTAMGIWAIWVPLGSTLMFLLAPLLASRWSWQGVWGFGFFYAALSGMLYYFFLPATPKPFSDGGNIPPPRKLTGLDLAKVFRNRELWWISFLFGCFNFVFVAFITWAPTFLHQTKGISLAGASLLVSAVSILPILSCPAAGWLSDKIGSRKLICIIPLLLMAALFPLTFNISEALFLPLAMGLGFIGGFVPAGVFSSGVEVAGDERLSGMAMAVIQIGQNAGMLFGPMIFGWMVESMGGWQMAFWTLTPVSALGAMAGWKAKIK